MPVRVLALCAAKDRAVLRQLDMFLATMKTSGLIQLEGATDAPEDDAAAKVREADLLLVMLSPKLLASSMWRTVVAHDAREARDAGRLRAVPVLLEACDYESSWLGQLMGLPRGGVSISRSRDPDSAWIDIAADLRRVVESMPPGPRAGGGGASKSVAGAGGGGPQKTSDATAKPAAPVDPEILRHAYRVLHLHHTRLLRLMDATQGLVAREFGAMPEATFEPYVLRYPNRPGSTAGAGGEDGIPLESASFTWVSKSGTISEGHRLVVVHEGNGAPRSSARGEPPGPEGPTPEDGTSTLAAYVTSVWLPRTDSSVTWGQVDEWIRRASGYSPAEWEDGVINTSASIKARILFGGFVRPLAKIDFEKPAASWLDPLSMLLTGVRDVGGVPVPPEV